MSGAPRSGISPVMFGLRAMAAVKAACDLGLDPQRAAALALVTGSDVDRLAEQLASALVEDGALRVPDAV